MDVVARALNWGLLAVLPFLLSQEVYGQVGVLLAAESLVGAVLILGQDHGLLRYYNAQHRKDAILSEALVIWAWVSGLLALTMPALLARTRYFLGIRTWPTWALLLASTDILVLHRLYVALSRALSDSRRFGQARLSYVTMRAALVTLAAILVGSAMSVMAALVVAAVGVVTFEAYVSFRKNSIFTRVSYNRRIRRHMVAFGWPLVFQSLSGTALIYVDRLLLAHLAGLKAVGIYTLAYAIGSAAFFVHGVSAAAIEPMIYSGGTTDAARWLSRLYLLTAIGMATVGGIIVLSLPVIGLLYGSEYRGLVVLVPIIVATYALFPLLNQAFIRLTLQERTLWLAAGTTAGLVLNVLANLVLIPRYGALGAAYATLLTYAGLSVVLYGLALSASRMPARPLIERGLIVVNVLAALASGVLHQVVASALLMVVIAIGSAGVLLGERYSAADLVG